MADQNNPRIFEYEMGPKTLLVFQNYRVVYPWLFKPWINQDDENKGYRCTLIVPKTDKKNLEVLWGHFDAHTQAEHDLPVNQCKTCIFDGDDTTYSQEPWRRGAWLVKLVSNKYRPVVRDPGGIEMTKPDERYCYAGSYVQAIGSIWSIDPTDGKPYVGLNFSAIQHMSDAENLSPGMRISNADIDAAFGMKSKESPAWPRRTQGKQDDAFEDDYPF